jgi:hypothetical protein
MARARKQFKKGKSKKSILKDLKRMAHNDAVIKSLKQQTV